MPATQFGTPRRRTRRSVKEVFGVDYAIPAFSNAGRRFWKGADCPTLCAKDVDGIAPSDCTQFRLVRKPAESA
jgi:hypothetical protein